TTQAKLALLPPLPRLGGGLQLRLHGKRKAGVITVDGRVEGESLVLPGARVGRLAVHLSGAGPGPLALGVGADGVSAGGVTLRTVTLRADGDRRKAIGLRAGASASDDRTLSLAARVVPTGAFAGGLPSGFEVSLDELAGRLGDREVALVGP